MINGLLNRHSLINRLRGALALVIVGVCAACSTPAKTAFDYQIEPRWGGRIVHLALPGRDNIMAFNEDAAAQTPSPTIAVNDTDVPYLGHAVWIGPQSKWWADQSIAPERFGQPWPPDPWLTLAATDAYGEDCDRILRSPESPLSGVRMEKRFVCLDDGGLRLDAVITNIRKTPVSWNVWFNTRVVAEALVFAPVDSADDVIMTVGTMDGVGLSVAEGVAIMSLTGRSIRVGTKLQLTPADGWMAAWHDGQLFVILFQRQPEALIPEGQGQLEFYFANDPADPQMQFIEMEMHGPLADMLPGESNSAGQVWYVMSMDALPTASDVLRAVADLQSTRTVRKVE